jgi:membrane protein implicated in regulation of membrane protease activity
MRVPRGFLGTDSDALIDLIIVALPVVLLVMFYAIREAKKQRWSRHKAIQITLAVILAIVVTALEIDLRTMSDGVMKMAERSRFAGTGLLRWTLNVHLVFSTSTALLWIWLIVSSLRKFESPPKPGDFSRKHRFWGRIAAIDMALTAGTGLLFYVLCFVLVG